MISKRQKAIITILLNQSDWITSSKMAEQLNISIRTLKSEIQTINKMETGLIHSGKKGYKLQKEKGASLLKEQINQKEIPNHYEERKQYILKKLLLENEVSFDQLLEALYITETTLQNELNRIRNDIAADQLNIHIRKDSITISGSDKGKRKVLLELINQELEDSFFSLTSIQKIFPHVDLTIISNIVTEILSENEYFLDDYSFVNYVIHIAMMIEMSKNKTVRNSENDWTAHSVNEEFNHMIIEIYHRLTEAFPYSFSIDNLYEVSVLMMTRITLKKQISEDMLELIDDDILKLMEHIIIEVKRNYAIDLNHPHFLVPFSFHLKNLIIRLQNHVKITNLQFKQIKLDYPLLYSVSVFISKKIEEYAHTPLPEDEIAYISLHIGSIIEEQRILHNKLQCVIFAPNYYSLGERLGKQLTQSFPDSLFITNIVTALDDIKDSDQIDFIITTSSQPIYSAIKSVQVKPFLSEEDIHKCYLCIEELKKTKQKEVLLKKIDYFFHKDCFFLNQGFQTKTEVIEHLCDTLYQEGYVNKDYKQKIYERENISSSFIGNIAIPHPLTNDAKKSVIAVAIEKKEIAWGQHLIHVVFMLSLKKEDHDYFVGIFDFISILIQNEEMLKKLTNLQSYEEFIELLCSTS